MPTTKTARTASTPAADLAAASEVEPLTCADALARTAAECVRLHQRYSCLVENGATEAEQDGAAQLCALADDLLGDAAHRYETNCGRASGGTREEWRLHAGALWLASKQYVRRHRETDQASRRSDHSMKALARLTLGFDLEASALLFLQQALDAYRTCRPESRLTS